MATVGDGYLPWIHHYLYARCDDIKNRCPQATCQNNNQPSIPGKKSDLVAYSMNKAPDTDYPMVNFCPSFFNKRSLADAMTYGKGRDDIGANTLINYDSQAQTMFHEISHLHLGADSVNGKPNPEIEHLMMWVTNGEELRWVETMVYGVTRSKILARYVKEVDSQKETGYWVQRNADNLAWYAMAKYVQNDRKSYPHLPIITTEYILGSPWDPNALLALSATSPEVDLMTKSYDNFEPVPGCPDNLDSDAISSNTFDPALIVNFTKMSADTDYPADYQAMKKEWLAQITQVLGTSIGKRASQTSSGKVEREWNA